MSSAKFSDFEKVTQIIRDADGKIVGRTRLQKIAFLLEATGLGEGFAFEYRHYGPYSEELADAVSVGVMVGSFAEEERATGWGGTYSIFTVNSNGSRHASGSRLALIAAASAADPVALELAATAAFLANEGEANPWDETARRKPEKAAARLAEARSLYDKLASIATPKPLPHIRASAGAV